MTKTVDELEGEWRAAMKAVSAARDAEAAARHAWDAARLDATGLKGHKVAYSYKEHRKPVVTRHLLVDRSHNGYDGPTVSGKRILKDGTLGTMRADVLITHVTDCGPYVAPGEQA